MEIDKPMDKSARSEDMQRLAETVKPPEREVYRFVGDHLSLNVHHVAYILNILGVNVSPEAYERMPHQVKEHFVLVKV